jgi:Holliday junction DNA helicase RuvA
MIAFLKGNLEYVDENSAVIDAGGVGYRAYMSPANLAKLPRKGEPVALHTYLKVSEDAMDLYGFLAREELSMFKRIISVSGIGAKTGLSILSAISPGDFALAVATGDYKTIAKAPGIGAKGAQRLILELKEKIQTTEAFSTGGVQITAGGGSAASEAAEALMALGYSQMEAVRAVSLLPEGERSLEETIKLALKSLGRA